MAKKLRKKLRKGKDNGAIKDVVAVDNTASISINIQLVFERTDLSEKDLLDISGEMQSFLDESVKDFAKDIRLKSYKNDEYLSKGQVEAIGRVNGKVFRAIVTKEEV